MLVHLSAYPPATKKGCRNDICDDYHVQNTDQSNDNTNTADSDSEGTGAGRNNNGDGSGAAGQTTISPSLPNSNTSPTGSGGDTGNGPSPADNTSPTANDNAQNNHNRRKRRRRPKGKNFANSMSTIMSGYEYVRYFECAFLRCSAVTLTATKCCLEVRLLCSNHRQWMYCRWSSTLCDAMGRWPSVIVFVDVSVFFFRILRLISLFLCLSK